MWGVAVAMLHILVVSKKLKWYNKFVKIQSGGADIMSDIIKE